MVEVGRWKPVFSRTAELLRLASDDRKAPVRAG